MYNDSVFTVFELHSGWVSKHFSVRELFTRCTKQKVGLNYMTLSNLRIYSRITSFSVSDLGIRGMKASRTRAGLSSSRAGGGRVKVGCGAHLPMAQERVDGQPSLKVVSSYEFKYISLLSYLDTFLRSRSLLFCRSSSYRFSTMSFDSIPILDLSQAKDPATKAQFLDELRHALLEVGFLYLKNVGIPDKLTQKVIKEGIAFFDLPMEEKSVSISLYF